MISRGRSALVSVGFSAVLCSVVGACGSGLVEPSDRAVATRIRAGFDFTCALAGDGLVSCWGRNNHGQLGIGEDTAQIAPVQVRLDERVISLSTKAIGAHVCAVTERGSAFCWGQNDFGQLGDGSTTERSVPTAVTGGFVFRSIAAGWRFTCALTVDADAYCWGRGEWGQLGDGLAVNSTTPVPVRGGHKFEQIDVGSNNLVCGLTRSGEVLCWGLDIFGSLGSPSTEMCTRADGLVLACASVPQAVLSDESFVSLTVGNSYACAVDSANDGWCWGLNSSGQLGSSGTTTCPSFDNANELPCSPVPRLADGGLEFRMIAAGVSHTCGVVIDGDGYCWGVNEFGQRGDGLLGNTVTQPAPIAGGLEFLSVSAGANHSCGEAVGGALWCWGANDVGQLGTGSNNIELQPAAVSR